MRVQRGFRFSLEGPPAAAPQHLSQILSAIACEHVGQGEEAAEQGGAIVRGQLDQAGLLDEAAQLDQVAAVVCGVA